MSTFWSGGDPGKRRPSTSPARLDGLAVGIPLPPTPLVGREGESVTATSLLQGDDVRLLTLTGTGGVGKTSLALHLAAEWAPTFPDGVGFVPLAAIHDADLVLPAIAHALGIQVGEDDRALDALLCALRDRRLLLVLDNVEQVAPAAPLLAHVLASCPRLVMLATSREPLRVRAEHVLPVEPLDLPELGRPAAPEDLAHTASVALFLHRARAVSPDFILTRANAPVVAEICRRVDGLPLAIELAAARIRVLPPEALLARLERGLPLLTGGPRDLPTRLQTMQGAIAWSYNLLCSEEQVLFRRLAVFVGGFTLDAAEAVANANSDLDLDILEGLASLVDKSLLRREEGLEGEPRLGILETIRAYGLERLEANGETEDARRRHAAYYLGLAEAPERAMLATGQGPWLSRLEADHANLLAALAWLEDVGEPELSLLLSGALGLFWYDRGFASEGKRWLERALARGGLVRDETRAKGLLAAGLLGGLQGNYQSAVALAAESLAIRRWIGDAPGVAIALHSLGIVARFRRDYDRAAELVGEARELFRASGDKVWTAKGLAELGLVAHGQEVPVRAATLLEEALSLNREVGNEWEASWVLLALADVARSQGDHVGAVRLYQETLGRGVDQMLMAECLAGVASLAAACEESEQAARLFGAADAMRQGFDFHDDPGIRAGQDRVRDAARANLGSERSTAAWAAGAALPPEAAIAEAAEFLATVSQSMAEGQPPGQSDALAYPAGLSGREVEVLRLVAQGLTNTQVAEHLYLSPNTIRAHLRHIYRKLGVSSRAEATRAVLDHGLL